MTQNLHVELKQPLLRLRIQGFLKVAALAAVAWCVLSVGQVAIFAFVDPPSSAVIQRDRIERFWSRSEQQGLTHRWVDFEQISEQIPIALIAAEDQQFPFHSGFDLAAIRKAVEHNQQSKSLRGGSTITQQVAKNLFLWQERSYLRKGLETWYAFWIDLIWSKQRIIEVYANIAEFGDGVYGVEAAAQTFYAKPALRLSARESATLAAVLPSPKRYNARNPGPWVRSRANWIQRQVIQLGGPEYLYARVPPAP